MGQQPGRFARGVPSPGAPADNRAAFVAAAPGKAHYPWQAAGVSRTAMISFSSRLPQELEVKMKWLWVNQKQMSVQDGLVEALEQYFEREAKMLGLNI